METETAILTTSCTGEEHRAADAVVAPPTTRTIEGWLIQYNKLSHPSVLDSGRKVYEVITRDAFKESVDQINAGVYEIEANIEHVDDAICRIGLTGRNVKVENRPEGVYARITLIGDTVSNDLFERVKAKFVTGMSVEFQQIPGMEPAYDISADGSYIRKLAKLKLTGFAVTVGPKYPDAQIVAATETELRSIKADDTAAIAREIAALESAALARQHDYYHRKMFLLGIRR